MTTSKSDVPSEIAFLIEMPQSARRSGQPPTYWGYDEGSEGWTCDINDAIRFDTFEAADMRGSDCGILDYEVIEHAWVAKPMTFNAGIEAAALKPKRRNGTSHGHTVGRVYSPTYHSWQAMLARCRYVARDTQKKHAARGIKVCERWQSFGNFLADMGERPVGTTLDRRDNDRDYEPSNCRWATPTEQARNRRNSCLNLETATEVAVRRLRGETCKSIASDYGISESLPREIVAGRTWCDALVQARAIISEQNND